MLPKPPLALILKKLLDLLYEAIKGVCVLFFVLLDLPENTGSQLNGFFMSHILIQKPLSAFRSSHLPLLGGRPPEAVVLSQGASSHVEIILLGKEPGFPDRSLLRS